MAQDRFDIWLDQARATGKLEIWRIALSLLLSFVSSVVLFWLFIVMAAVLLGADHKGIEGLSNFEQSVMMLAPFAGVWIALIALRFWLHGLALSTLWGWNRKLDWKPFLGGLFCSLLGRILYAPLLWGYLALSGQLESVQAADAAAMQAAAGPPENFVWIAILMIPLVFIQTGAEEALFRGHMTQILAARWRPFLWIWAGIPTLLFALLHITSVTPAMGMGFFISQILFAAGVGVICTAMTRVEGGISAAIGFHFCNNYLIFIGMIALGVQATPQMALELSGLDSWGLIVSLALNLGACVAVFCSRRLPFGRWIGLDR